MNTTEAAAFVLAQGPQPPGDPGGQGEDFGKSSPVGLLLLVVFAISIVLLVRSMSKHLRKLPTTFDEDAAAAAAPARADARESESAAQRTESAARTQTDTDRPRESGGG